MEKFQLSSSERRTSLLIIIALMMMGISIGLFKLQILQHSELYSQSENNRIRVMPIIPKRGRIFDRHGNIIVDNRPSYTVSIIPAEEIKGVTVQKLSELIKMDTTEIRKRIKRNLVSHYQPASIKRDVSFEIIAVLEEQSGSFPGVTYQQELVRKYKSDIAGEVFTGYVGEISPEELKKTWGENYRPGSLIGKKGLEKQYDGKLRGYEGTQYIEVSAFGEIIGEINENEVVPPLPGSDLFLTIDAGLQRACVAALDTFCCGTIIAIDPRNGEVLALLSNPGYDANIFSSVIPESLWNEIRNDTTHPLLNRPLNGLYPPGSTTKFIILGAGLEERLIRQNSTFDPCLGGYQFGNRFFGCWNAEGHGIVEGVEAIEVSCDTYFYQLGLKLGLDGLNKYFALCGLGKVTGIDLPLESRGLNPDKKYYDNRYGIKKWTRGIILNLAIGQGELLVNIIQLAQFYCGMVNNGTVYHPHLVKKVIGPDDTEILSEPSISFKLPFSKETIDVLLEGLRATVEGNDGTARSLKNDYYSLGGKTGTSENPHGENHSWFVGVAPLENPQIVIAAIVENSGHGSEVAAPMIGKILNYFFEVPLDTMTVTDKEEQI